MGDHIDKEKQPAQTTDQARKAPAPTTKDDHSPAAAKAASNNDLRRRSQEHASKRTYESVQNGLSLLAKAMHAAPQELGDAQAKEDRERNNSNEIDDVERIVHAISSDATNLNSLLGMTDNAVTMAPEVKKVWGAWSLCQGPIARALKWAHHDDHAISLSIGTIDEAVKAMIQKLEADPKHFPADLHAPEGKKAAMDETAFAGELQTARMLLESYVAGNGEDGRRLVAITQLLGAKGNASDAFKHHHDKVRLLANKIDASRDDGKYPRLAEAWRNLDDGLTRK